MLGILKKLMKNRAFLLLVLPGAAWFIIFAYLPMFGTIIAFKDFRIHPGGFLKAFLKASGSVSKTSSFCSRPTMLIS